MKTVDTRGMQCPAPIIAAKKALNEAEKGEIFRILTDNPVSLGNLKRFLTDNLIDFSVEESQGYWILTVTRSEAVETVSKAEEYCNVEIPHFTRAEFIIAVTSDEMGRGDEQLGRLLMVNYLKALKDLDPLPAKMVFYNRGVLLCTSDSDVAGDLKMLEQMGVKLLLCSTCINYYSLNDRINIGTLSNMYEIARAMASASNVIKP